MRLCRFEIRNFKGIQEASFEWDDIVVLIGENNAGKSTVLQALRRHRLRSTRGVRSDLLL